MLNTETVIAVSLRIHSQNMRASAISELLQIAPSAIYEKGDLYSKRNPNSSTREESLWILESGCDISQTVEEHIFAIVKILTTKSYEIRTLLKNCTIDIFIGLCASKEQNTFELGNKAIMELSEFPIDLLFDIYCKEP